MKSPDEIKAEILGLDAGILAADASKGEFAGLPRMLPDENSFPVKPSFHTLDAFLTRRKWPPLCLRPWIFG